MALPPNKAVRLWLGPMQIKSDTHAVAGRGQVQLVFRPSPRVRCVFASRAPESETAALFGRPLEPIFPDLSTPPPAPGVGRLWTRSWPGENYRYRSTVRVPRLVAGDPSDLSSVVIGVVNFTDQDLGAWHQLDGETGSRSHRQLDIGDWRLVIWGRPDGLGEHSWSTKLQQLGGYAITHAVVISRHDRARFHLDDVEPLRDSLFHVLSFARGRLVGLAIPTGYREDELVAVSWQTTVTEPWESVLSWFDATLGDALAGLVENYVSRSNDPFWSVVLRRAIRMTVQSNRATPLDAAIPLAAATLELLGWAVESVGLAPQLPPKTPADKRIRGLLSWAGIPLEIPSELSSLEARAVDRHQPDADAASVIVGLRNRLMHPPKKPKTGDWPSHDLMLEAFRLSLEFCELSILRILGYEGNYGTRRHLDGRWFGQTEAVPWLSPTTDP